MSAQLQQILEYLAQDDVREVILAVGRKVAIRQDSGYFSLTAKPLSHDQLLTLVRGTSLAPLVNGGVAKKPHELELYGEPYRVQVGVHGDDLIMRIDRVPHEMDLDNPTAPARKKGNTPPPRKKGQTPPPRAKGMTKPPRAKGMTNPPRTKSPTAPQAKPPRSRNPSSISLELDDIDLGVVDGLGGVEGVDNVAALGRADTVAGAAGDEPEWGDIGEFELEPGTGGGVPIEPAAVPWALPAKPERVPMLPPKHGAQEADETATTTQLPKISNELSGEFTALVRKAQQHHASDLHVAAARPISVRVAGQLVPLANVPLSPDEAEALLMPLLDEHAVEQLRTAGYVDLAVEVEGGGRLRANISRHQAGLKGSFRLARAVPPTLDELGLPAAVAKVVSHHQGLVVIAGPSGHGKTTTLAALVDVVNGAKPYHILTIEDPIEIVYPRKAAVVSQRETGRHTKSFATALKASLREDPDVIVIGELRDRESVEIALTAAETGHLVIATMSTPSAAKTLDRLIDMFPPDEHSQVRASIAGALRAIVAQRLVPAKQGGVVAAIELVTGVLPLATLIRDDKLYQLPSLMQRGRAFGMIRFDESLAELVKAGKVTEEAALPFAENKKLFARPG